MNEFSGARCLWVLRQAESWRPEGDVEMGRDGSEMTGGEAGLEAAAKQHRKYGDCGEARTEQLFPALTR